MSDRLLVEVRDDGAPNALRITIGEPSRIDEIAGLQPSAQLSTFDEWRGGNGLSLPNRPPHHRGARRPRLESCRGRQSERDRDAPAPRLRRVGPASVQFVFAISRCVLNYTGRLALHEHCTILQKPSILVDLRGVRMSSDEVRVLNGRAALPFTISDDRPSGGPSTRDSASETP